MNEITITTYDKSPKNKNKQRKQKIDKTTMSRLNYLSRVLMILRIGCLRPQKMIQIVRILFSSPLVPKY